MSTPHLEVIPRIIDTSIAANYQTTTKSESEPTNDLETQKNNSNNEVKSGSTPTVIPYVPPTFTQRFFSTLKDYIVPILFIIAVMVVIYIGWKYWTTYRNKTTVVPTVQSVIESEQSNIPPKEDLSRFLLSENNSDDDNESIKSKLSTIMENSLETETQSNDADTESNNDADEHHQSDNDESDNESIVSEPDFSAISNLINQPIDDYHNSRFEYLPPDNTQNYIFQEEEKEDTDNEEEKEEEKEDYLFDISSIHTETATDQDVDETTDSTTEPVDLTIETVVKSKPKKSKKTKRIVL